MHYRFHAVAVSIHKRQRVTEIYLDVDLACLCSELGTTPLPEITYTQYSYSHSDPWLVYVCSNQEFLSPAKVRVLHLTVSA